MHIYRSSRKENIILVIFEPNLHFLNRYWESTQISNPMTIRTLRSESFHGNRWNDGRTDRHKEVNSRSLQFLNAPKTATEKILLSS